MTVVQFPNPPTKFDDKYLETLRKIGASGYLVVGNEKQPIWPSKGWQEKQLPAEEAFAAAVGYGATVKGVGAIANLDLCFLDFDPIEDHHIENATRYGMSRADVNESRKLIQKDMVDNTMCEVSPRGIHAFFKVTKPFTGRWAIKMLKTCLAIDVIHGFKYMTVTGMPMNDLPIDDGTEYIEDLFGKVERRMPRPVQHRKDGRIGVDNLPDNIVWSILNLHRNDTYLKIAREDPCDFSEVAKHAIGDLAKISSDPSQVMRMLGNTPLIRSPVLCQQGTTKRSDKFLKMFGHWWEEAQTSNVDGVSLTTREQNPYVPSIEHGQLVANQLTAALAREKAERKAKDDAREEEERQRSLRMREEMLADRAANVDLVSPLLWETMRKLSCGIKEELLHEHEAPEHIERLIQCNVDGMKVPFRKFAVVATFGVLSGIMGRRYKTQDEIPSAIMAVLGASSSAGKGEAFRFWKRQVTRAQDGFHNPRTRVYTGPVGSQEGMHIQIEKCGSFCWMLEECSAQLGTLYADDRISAGIRDKVNEIFDSGYHDAKISPPGSVSAANRKNREVRNISMSMAWSTTIDALTDVLSKHGLTTGFGARAVFIVHDDKAGKTRRDDVLRDLPPDAYMWLKRLVTDAELLDDMYDPEPGEGALEKIDAAKTSIVYAPYDEGAMALKRDLEDKVDDIRDAVATHEVPDYYVIFTRAAMLAAKFALVCAVTRNLDAPVITYDDYAWALGYVLRCFGELATALDEGKYDVQLSDAHKVVLAAFDKLLMKSKTGYVIKSEINRNLMRNAQIKKLADKNRQDPTRLINLAFTALEEMDIVIGQQLENDGKTRAPYVFLAGEAFDKRGS